MVSIALAISIALNAALLVAALMLAWLLSAASRRARKQTPRSEPTQSIEAAADVPMAGIVDEAMKLPFADRLEARRRQQEEAEQARYLKEQLRSDFGWSPDDDLIALDDNDRPVKL
jgi:hypothetical protein